MTDDTTSIDAHAQKLPPHANPGGYVLRAATAGGVVLDSQTFSDTVSARLAARSLKEQATRYASEHTGEWVMIYLYCGDCGQCESTVRLGVLPE